MNVRVMAAEVVCLVGVTVGIVAFILFGIQAGDMKHETKIGRLRPR